MADYAKPIPHADEASAPYFEGAKAHKLMLMQCQDCGLWRYPSRHHCSNCWSENTEWKEASGKGTVYTWAAMHQLYHPGFEPDLPYVIAVIELAEGPRIPTNIVGATSDELRVGMPVEVTFEDIDEEVSIPKFKPSR
jgi:uncharacterized OB-fold protein